MKLTKKQIEILMHRSGIEGAETRTPDVTRMVELGLYRDSGDAFPFFTRTGKGDKAADAFYTLKELEII